MATREQDYQQLNGVLSIIVGDRHMESVKSSIKALQTKQKEINEKLKEVSAQKVEPQEVSFAVKNAPVIGAIAGAFIVLQFFRFSPIILMIAAIVAAGLGFVIGIVIKKDKQNAHQDTIKKSLEENRKEIQNYNSSLAENKKELAALQKELMDAQEDVALLRKSYLSEPAINLFCKTYGLDAVEVLILYFERGRADSIEEAIELYKDEARDKARIERAKAEIERSTYAYMNSYIETLNRLGRSREFSYMEDSAKKHNKNLERENKELREIMNKPKNI